MKYSIITPVYNRADCIARCLDSVIRNLAYGIEVEHIVVDDGSVDNSAQIVKDYASRYDHIQFVQLPHNRGTNAARNAAIAVAKGDFCIILDSDDYFVDDALYIIDHTVSTHNYKQYMFAADDMVDDYARNPLLNKAPQTVLEYKDFLAGRVAGDFIHCVSTQILRNHPFREDLRIHEGVFFLQFYREAQQVLFTNTIVTIRERSRADSVTRGVIRTNQAIIQRCLDANTLQIDLFRDDYHCYGFDNILQQLLVSKAENALLLNKYDIANESLAVLPNSKKVRMLKFISILHIGNCFRLALKAFLFTKYKILKSQVI